MDAVTSCRICRKPSPTSVCGDCRQSASYANPEYKANRGEMMRDAEVTYLVGEHVLCVICQLPVYLLSEVTVEHVIPLRSGGTHARENLGYAHSRCNSLMKPAPPKKRYRRI